MGNGSERHRGRQRQSGDSPQLSHVFRVSKSPDDVRKCAFSKVARLQADIASLDEDQERSSLQQALKRAQQQTVLPLVDQRIADCVQFIECAKKRVQSAEADAKKVEAQRLRGEELAAAAQRLADLQQEAAHFHKHSERKRRPTVQQDPPPEWALEIQRLRTEVARFKASRLVRDSVDAAQNVRAKAEKRRCGFMDDVPTDSTESEVLVG